MDKFPYRLGNDFLEYVKEEKALGVRATPSLSWTEKCELLIRSASSRLGLIKTTCHFVKNRKQRLVRYKNYGAEFVPILRKGVTTIHQSDT